MQKMSFRKSKFSKVCRGKGVSNALGKIPLFLEGPEGGVPIPFPSLFFFQIPLRNSQILFPFLIFNIFSHSQWLNPSPSVAWTPFFHVSKTCQSQFPFCPFRPSSWQYVGLGNQEKSPGYKVSICYTIRLTGTALKQLNTLLTTKLC